MSCRDGDPSWVIQIEINSSRTESVMLRHFGPQLREPIRVLMGKWVNLIRSRLSRRVQLERRARLDQKSVGDQVESLQTRILPAITFQFDYSLDATNFFDPINNPERRQVLEQAGNDLGSRLQDTILEIIPHKFNVADTWTATFEDPSSGGNFDVDDLIVGENILRVYVGARNIGGSLGSGGPGFASSVTGVQQWVDTVLGRGQAGALGPYNAQTDFSPFGGSIAFDESANWHFGTSTVGLEAGEFDFFSTAVHELAHVIGFGTAPSFNNLVSGSVFNGSSSFLEYDGSGPVPLEDPGHWQKDLPDNGTEVALDPDLADGVRKNMTALDYAGLNDLGWQVDGGDSYSPTILLANNMPNSLVIQDDGIAGNGMSEFILNGDPPVSFATGAADLFLAGGNDDDSISIESIDSSFTGEILVDGGDGDDLLDIDHSVSDVISYNGELGNDSLALQGSPVDSVTHSFTNGSDGSVLIADASDTSVFYAGLEPIFDSIVATDRFFEFGGTADVITLDDEGVPGNGIMRLSSVSSSETVHFADATGTVTIDTGGGDDSVTILAIDFGFSAAVEVNVGSGNDTVNAAAATTALLLNGESGNDTITGGSGNDTLSGGDDDDQLQGGGGNDSLEGGNGTDTISESGDVDFVLDASSLTGVGSDQFTDIEQASLTGGDSANTIDASLFTGSVTVTAGAGNDTLIGSDNDDELFGNGDDDSLVGGLGNDLVNGGADNDLVFGGEDDDVVLGGAGNDTLEGENGNDDIRGQSGDDRIAAGQGDDTIDGGDGADYLVASGNVDFTLTDVSLVGVGTDQLANLETVELAGGFSGNLLDASGFSGDTILRGFSGADTLVAGSGNDILIGYAGRDRLFGNDGDDTLLGSAGSDHLDGGAGNDRLRGQGSSRDELFGGSGNDQLDGGAGSDSLSGDGGQDTLQGETGNDQLNGGAGNDSLLGGTGSDILNGDDGQDTLLGESGNDQLNGGTGDDSLLGSDGADTLDGGEDNDTLVGGNGDDQLFGQAGNDGLDGGAGNDIVNGGAGNDALFGGSGNDSMYGGNGSDLVIGMSGADVVKGQGGFDILAGGSGTGADAGDIVDGDPDELDEIFSITLPVWVESQL
jgi:Ca2+-binding RTX toxin-like protein